MFHNIKHKLIINAQAIRPTTHACKNFGTDLEYEKVKVNEIPVLQSGQLFTENPAHDLIGYMVIDLR